MNLPRIFASAVARRLAYVLVALALGWLGIGTARAAGEPEQCRSYGMAVQQGCTQGLAFSLASTALAMQAPSLQAYIAQNGSNSVCVFWTTPSGCYYQYFWAPDKSCSAQPPLYNVRYQGAVCSGGCSYEPSTSGQDVARTNSIGGVAFQYATNMVPTGNACTVQDITDPVPDDQDQCVQQGTLTQCVTKDGDICTQASNGKRFCFGHDEAGVKTSQNEAASKIPGGLPSNMPPVPPTNGGDWTKIGETPITQTTTNNNTTITNNSTINNYSSSYGSSGTGASGGGASGEPNGGGSGDGDGDGGGDGDDPGHGTVGGGATCEQGFTCTGGDPVLCAIAQQQYMARCEASGRGDGEVGPFPGTGDGGAGDDPSPADSHRTASPGLGWIDTTGILGGGSCPQFESVTTRFGDFTINGDDWCQIIGIARAALLIFGAFIALGILMGWGGKD